MLLLATILVSSCGEDRQGDIDKLNALHASIEGRVTKLESQVSTLNTQLTQVSALAYAVEQGFYITQVKATADGYELTLNNGKVIVLQNTPGGMLVPTPAVSMTQINGFYFWTINGIVITGNDGQPVRAGGITPVVRYDYTLNQWVISIDGGVTFRDINEYVSVVINDQVLLQVINSYMRQYQNTIISQQVMFQIISTYIQQHYKELFSIDILNQVVATYIKEHYTRIFSYELLEKIFTQYNFSYVRENIKVEELINVIVQFIKDHKEVFVDNDVLFAIITNYIEMNKTTIFSNELLLQVINDFIEHNENFIDVELLTLVVNNYIDEHADVVFNTETIRTLLTRYVEKWYVQIFSQDILIRVLSTYVTEHSETIFNRTLIEEVVNNYIQNNSTTIITHDQLVEIINNYLKVNTTTVFNREVLIDIIITYFEKNYSLYIKREDIVTAVNNYLTTHETTIISVDIISEIVNSYLRTYFKEVFTVDLLKQVIINYFQQYKEEITVEFDYGKAPITNVIVDGDVCVVTLFDGQTVQLQVYGEGSQLSKIVQSLVILPNSEGRIDGGNPLQLRYLVSPASMAQVIATDANITMELVTTDGSDAGSISRIAISEASATGNGLLSVSGSIGESAKAVALHVKDSRNSGTDIMTEFTPVVSEITKPGYLQCPDDNHPHMIDLGLPSGTLWACCNVGATKPEEYGYYYAWGETWVKYEYTWSTYKYGDSSQNVTNIGSDIAFTSYDVATENWKNPWGMPTDEQRLELINHTAHKWITIGNSSGLKFIGANGGEIFLPAAGHMSTDGAVGMGSEGFYWTSTLSESAASSAQILHFTSSSLWQNSSYRRFQGNSVRPVANP